MNRLLLLVFVLVIVSIPGIVLAQSTDCEECVSVSSGAREAGYPPCLRWFEGGRYEVCPKECCMCWLTTVSKLDEKSKDALRVWEQQVWQPNPVLNPLSDHYRDFQSWGWYLAQLVDQLGHQDENRLVLQWIALTVTP